MKRMYLTSLILFFGLTSGFAQEMVSQPTHVVGKRINAEGVVTRELVSDFLYNDEGMLTQFSFPEYAISASYHYTEGYLTQEWIAHQGGHPTYYENNLFTYEDGLLKTKTHLMDQMGISLYWVYYYYDDGRLERIDYRTEDFDFYPVHWLYEYEDGGKTLVESYYTSWNQQGMVLEERTTSHYDEDYVLSDQLVEKFNASGEPTSTKLIGYSYTPSGMLEESVFKVLTEGQWQNSTITRYSYDDEDRTTERLDGTWDPDNATWHYTKKITFETSEDGQTYTVSFFKQGSGTWVRDVFDHQPILFSSNQKAQQRALGYYVYEDMNGEGNINQFEITLELTKKPIYMSVGDDGAKPYAAYPNPGRNNLKVTAPVQNAVIRLYDLQGRMLLAKPFDFQTEINAGGWAKGIYLWEIWNGPQKEASGKWIKE